MESNRPDEERAAVPEQQQDVPPVAEDVVTPPAGPGAEDPTDVPLDYVPPPEDRGEDVPLDYVPPPEGIPEEIGARDQEILDEFERTEGPTDVPLDYVPPPEDRGEDVPLDYVPPPEDRGEDVPGFVTDYTEPAPSEDDFTPDPDWVPDPGSSVSGWTDDEGNFRQDTGGPPGSEAWMDEEGNVHGMGLVIDDPEPTTPEDYVPPPEDRGEDVPLDYVPPPEDRGEFPAGPGAEDFIDYPEEEYTSPGPGAEDIITSPGPGAEDVTTSPTAPGAEDSSSPINPFDDGLDVEGVTEALGDVDWEGGIASVNEGLEGVNDAIRHAGLIPGGDMAGEFGDQAQELGQNLGEGNWEQAYDTAQGMYEGAVDKVAAEMLGEELGDSDKAEQIVQAARHAQDAVGEGAANAITDISEGNWGQAYDDYQGTVDSVATSALGAAIGDDAAESVVQGYRDAQDAVTDTVGNAILNPEQAAEDLTQALGDAGDTVADAIENPEQAAENLVQALGDVDWQSANEDLEGINDAIRHAGLMGPGMAGEFGDQAQELGQNLGEGNWEQAYDNYEGMVDEVAKGVLGEYVGDEGAERVVGAARDIQDTVGEAETNIVADVFEGNWGQAYDDYQGGVDDVATTALGAAIGDDAAESVVQGYHDVQDTVTGLETEAVEGVADALGDVFDW